MLGEFCKIGKDVCSVVGKRRMRKQSTTPKSSKTQQGLEQLRQLLAGPHFSLRGEK